MLESAVLVDFVRELFPLIAVFRHYRSIFTHTFCCLVWELTGVKRGFNARIKMSYEPIQS